jgi:hypothetical protein
MYLDLDNWTAFSFTALILPAIHTAQTDQTEKSGSRLIALVSIGRMTPGSMGCS